MQQGCTADSLVICTLATKTVSHVDETLRVQKLEFQLWNSDFRLWTERSITSRSLTPNMFERQEAALHRVTVRKWHHSHPAADGKCVCVCVCYHSVCRQQQRLQMMKSSASGRLPHTPADTETQNSLYYIKFVFVSKNIIKWVSRAGNTQILYCSKSTSTAKQYSTVLLL